MLEKSRIYGFLIVGCCLSAGTITAQEFEAVVQGIQDRLSGKPVQITGGAGAQLSWYAAQGISNRAVPLQGQANAYLNLDILGIQAPFTLLASTGGQAFNYTLPSFMLAGLSPQYRWATLHLGDRQMDLGKYTFSQHSFRGAGLELRPGNWRLRSFYGRLRRSQAQDLQAINLLDPVFKRMGWGVQAGYEAQNSRLLATLFKAGDVVGSISLPDSLPDFRPAENAILSVAGRQMLSKVIELQGDWAFSGYTADRSNPYSRDTSWSRNFAGLLPANLSTRWNQAWNAVLLFHTNFGQLNVSMERIQPGYRTLGSLYFQDDLENIAAGGKFSIFKKKALLALQAGIQRNNLDLQQSNQYRRAIGSLLLQIQPGQEWSWNLNVSNFSNVNKLQAILDPGNPVATASWRLVQSNAQAGFIRTTGKDLLKMWSGQLNWQRGVGIFNDEIQETSQSDLWMAYLSYQNQNSISRKNWGASVNLQKQLIQGTDINGFRLSGNFGQSWRNDQYRLNGNAALTHLLRKSDTGSGIGSWIGNLGVNGSWKVNTHQELQLRGQYLDLFGKRIERPYREIRTQLQYNYLFK